MRFFFIKLALRASKIVWFLPLVGRKSLKEVLQKEVVKHTYTFNVLGFVVIETALFSEPYHALLNIDTAPLV